MIRNIIFDWSGTLVDDLPAVWRASNHCFTQAGIPEITLEQFRAEFVLPFKGFYDRYLPHVPMEQLEEWFHGHFKQAQDSVVALPFAREFLEFCRAHGIRTFLLSTVHPDHYEVQARNSGFGPFIDRPYVRVADKRTKIGEILVENGLHPAETLFIGDMQHDIETARHGGVHSCAVLTGYNRLDQLRASEPDLIVEHLGELRLILERHRFRLTPAIHSNGHAPSGHVPISTVGAAIFNDAGQLLMVQTQKWSGMWGIPGGKIKWGEPSEAALRREILEETNLKVDGIEFIMVHDCIHSPEFYRDAHFLLLNYICRARGIQQVRLNEEAQEFRWVDLEEAFQLRLNTPTRVLLEELKSREVEPAALRLARTRRAGPTT